jgi:hypothetical protein
VSELTATRTGGENITAANTPTTLDSMTSAMHKMAAIARRGVMIRERKYGFIPDHKKKTLPEELRCDQ